MRKVTGKAELRPDWRRIGLGIGVGVITMLAMTGAGAWLLERELVDLEWMNYLAAVILLVSAFAGAKTAGASAEQWMYSALTSLGFWLVLALIHVLGFGGGLKGAGATALAILGGSGAAVLLRRGGKRRSSRSRRYRNR